MKSRAARKPAADEDEARSKKIRSSRGGKRRRGRSSSPSGSSSGSPPRKRSRKPSSKKIVDKKSKKNKGTSRRRRRSLSPSRSASSPSSVSRSRSRRSSRHSSSSSASERSVSPPPRSRSRDARKRKGRDRDKDRKRRRVRRSRSHSSSSAHGDSSRGRSRSRSRKQRARGMRDDAGRDRIAQDYDNRHASRTKKNSIEDVDRDHEVAAIALKGVDDYEKNVELEKMGSPPSKGSHETGEISSPKDANETGEISSPKDANETGEISSPKNANETDKVLPAGGGIPEAEEDLELILRQRALENFKKFRGAAMMPGKTDSNSTGKGVLSDIPQNTVTRISEARTAVAPSQSQGNSRGDSHSAGSPELEEFENRETPWKQETSRGDRSPGILKDGDTSAPTQQQGSRLETIRSTSRIMSQDGRNGGSVMQRLGGTPASSSSVKQRLGISTGVRPAQATPRIRSVVSIPVREGLDGSTSIMTPMAHENPAPVDSGSEVRHPPVETNKLEGANGDDRNVGEASAPESSGLLLTDEGKSQVATDEGKGQAVADEGKGQAGNVDKDGSQFEKRTFSRMHDGETVQVSYKVYIPATSPRLARRKLQR